MTNASPGGARLRTAVLLVLGSAATSIAGPVAVVNPGFEATVLAPGTFFTASPPPGWSAYGSIDNFARAVGSVNPSGTLLYLEPVPEGANVGVVFLGTTPTGAEAGLEQTLAATLQPWTTYTLTVEVGNMGYEPAPPHGSFDFHGFPGYRVELLAGGVVIGSDADTLSPADGFFATSTVQVPVASVHAQLGQPLSVRLVNRDAAAGIEVNFDDVRLDASATGCPDAVPSGCKAATSGKGTLSFSTQAGEPAKNAAAWSWLGAATSTAEIGVAGVSSDYRLCAWDGANLLVLESSLAADATCAGASCWSSNSTSLRYKDAAAASGGISSLLLKTGDDSRARIRMKARGAQLAMPALPPATTPSPLTMALVNTATGACWIAEFSSADTAPGDTARWKARND